MCIHIHTHTHKYIQKRPIKKSSVTSKGAQARMYMRRVLTHARVCSKH